MLQIGEASGSCSSTFSGKAEVVYQSPPMNSDSSSSDVTLIVETNGQIRIVTARDHKSNKPPQKKHRRRESREMLSPPLSLSRVS
jgi:hypothetical protein